MRQGARNTVESADAILQAGFVEDRRCDGQIVSRLPEQGGSKGIELIGVRARILVLDRSVLDVATHGTARTDQRKRVCHDAVDPAAGVIFRPHHPQRQLVVDQREVEHEIVIVIEPAALGARENALGAGMELGQIGLIGNQPDRAAHRSRAKERALRPTQNLDAIQVIQRRIDDHVAVLRAGRAGQRDIVEIEADRRGIASARGHAAHLYFGLTRSLALQRDAGCRLRQVGE